MKTKNIIVTCAFTVVALVALLTLVPPQTAQAAGGVQFWTITWVNLDGSPSGLEGPYLGTRKDASWYCTMQNATDISVVREGSTHNICR